MALDDGPKLADEETLVTTGRTGVGKTKALPILVGRSLPGAVAEAAASAETEISPGVALSRSPSDAVGIP